MFLCSLIYCTTPQLEFYLNFISQLNFVSLLYTRRLRKPYKDKLREDLDFFSFYFLIFYTSIEVHSLKLSCHI